MRAIRYVPWAKPARNSPGLAKHQKVLLVTHYPLGFVHPTRVARVAYRVKPMIVSVKIALAPMKVLGTAKIPVILPAIWLRPRAPARNAMMAM